VIVKQGDGYVVKAHSGKKLGGPYTSKKQAENRLREVEYFKWRDKHNKPS
jgi:hypothetical protein